MLLNLLKLVGPKARMSQGKGRLRWNKFKWILFVTNSFVCFFSSPLYNPYFLKSYKFMVYSMVSLTVCLLIWFDIWKHADIIRPANTAELILSTITSCIGILTFLIGWASILLNNRSFLAWYIFLSWITFAFLVTPGYITYKRCTLNLEGKINAQWSRNPYHRRSIANPKPTHLLWLFQSFFRSYLKPVLSLALRSRAQY